MAKTTFYALAESLVIDVCDASGTTERIDFAGGSVSTDNPLWLDALERNLAMGFVTKTKQTTKGKVSDGDDG